MDCFLNNWSRWIEEQLRPDGAICDPYSKHSLPFQYHYAAFILGRLSNATRTNDDAVRERVWQYFCRLTPQQAHSSREFNGFLLCLAHWVALQRQRDCTGRLAEYLAAMPLPSIGSLRTRNRNFAFMLDFEMCYRSTFLQTNCTPAFRTELDGLLQQSLSADHLYIDSPAPTGGGYPSAVYVAKIALTRLLGALVNGQPHQLAEAKGAIDALIGLADVERVLSYGRSQLSLFGYANLLCGCQLLTYVTTDARYARVANTIENMLQSWQSSHGEVTLNPAKANRQRSGFDQYMHPIVYNVYSWAMLCLATFMIRTDAGRQEVIQSTQTTVERPSSIDERNCASNITGLVRYQSATYDCLFATRRFNDEPKLGRDARYQPAVPQILRHRQQDIIPPIPRDIGGFVRLAQRLTWFDRINASLQAGLFLFSNTYFGDFLDRAGFLPFLRLGRFRKICAGDQKNLSCDQTQDSLFIATQFELNAEQDRRLPWRKLRYSTSTPRSYGTLNTEISCNPTTLAIQHSIRFANPLPARAKLTHLNLRLTAAPARHQKVAGWWHFEIQKGVTIRHRPPVGQIFATECIGATRTVTYLRASTHVTPAIELNIQTILSFDESESFS